MFTKIIKRDGRETSFDERNITDAIFKAAQAVGGADREIAMELTLEVLKELKKKQLEAQKQQIEARQKAQQELVNKKKEQIKKQKDVLKQEKEDFKNLFKLDK